MSLQILFLFVFKLFYTGGEEKRRERNSPLLKNKFLNFWGGPGRTAQSCQNGPIYYHATCLHIELITLPHCKPTCIFVYLCSPLSLTHAPHTNSHYSQLSMAECRNTLPLSLMHTLLHLQTSLCGSCGVEEVSPLQMTKNKTWIMEKWSTTDRNAIYPWNAPTEVCLIMLTSP